jgi:hypothetical protein
LTFDPRLTRERINLIFPGSFFHSTEKNIVEMKQKPRKNIFIKIYSIAHRSFTT